MLDLEKCILKRETIYNKFASKNIHSSNKNGTKQKLMKILDDMRIMIRKIKTVTLHVIFYDNRDRRKGGGGQSGAFVLGLAHSTSSRLKLTLKIFYTEIVQVSR